MHISLRQFITAFILLLVAAIPAASQTGAITFNGTDQYADISAVGPDMTSSTTHTIEFWFKANVTQTDAGQVSLFAVNNSTGGNVLLITLGASSTQDGTINVYDGVNAAIEITSTNSFLDGQPHHIAFVRNGATGTLYVDGSAEGSSTAFQYNFGSTNHWSLGMEEDSGPAASDFFTGSVDEVRVWNAARPLDTLRNHLFQLKATNANLLGWWKCNEISGITLTDASGNGNNGTLMNSVAFSSPVIPVRPAAGTITVTPSVSTLGLGWTRGTGDSCMVVIGTAAPSALPVDNNFYPASSTYGSGALIGSSRVVYRGKGTSLTVFGLSIAAAYTVTVYEFDSYGGVSYYGTDAPATKATSTLSVEPSTASSNPSVTNVQTFSMTFNWSRGNGSNCIVLLHAGGGVTSAPLDGNIYTAVSTFASGSQIGSGNYAVYKGTGTSVTVSGLSANTTYHAAVYELNGSGGTENYKDAPVRTNAATLTGVPTIQAGSVTVSNIASVTASVSCVAGNGQSRLIVLRKDSPVNALPVDGTSYTANASFGQSYLSGDNAVVFSGTGNTVSVSGLTAASKYYLSIFEYNDVAGSIRRYMTPAKSDSFYTVAIEPGLPAAISAGSIVTTSAILTFTGGSGENRLVVMKQGSAVNFLPTDGAAADGLSGAPVINAVPLGGGNSAVYSGAGTSVNVANLLPGTIYHVAVFEYNGGSNTVNFRQSNPGRTSFGTMSNNPSPVTEISIKDTTVTTVTLRWKRGGTNTLVIMRAGESINATPTERTTYTANTLFGNGSAVGSGNYVVYAGTDTFVTVTGCASGTVYSVACVAYNVGAAGTENYETSAIPSLTFTVPTGSPNLQAQSPAIESRGIDTMVVSFIRGNGSNHLIIVGDGAEVTDIPQDGMDYFAAPNANFGYTANILGTGHVVYKGTDTTVKITGSLTGHTYYFAIFEFNIVNGVQRYLTPGAVGSIAFQIEAPSIPASNIHFTEDDSGFVTITWKKGNGNRRTVLMNKGVPVPAGPNDHTSVANNVTHYLYQDAVPTVLYDGIGTSEWAYQLARNSTYHLSIFEYNGYSSSTYVYQKTTAARDSFVTLKSLPSVPSSQLHFNDISPHSVTAEWTNGNGDGRIVVVRAGSTPALSFSNGPVPSANSVLGTLPPVSSDRYIVFAGMGNSVTVTGLTEGTTYYFSVIEYNINSAGRAIFRNSPTAQGSVVAETQLPVELVAFSGEAKRSVAELQWFTATEVNNYGFEVQRKEEETRQSSEWDVIGFVQGHGTTNAPQSYQFSDRSAPAGKYSYRLVQTDNDGKRRALDEVSLTVGAALKEFRLVQNYPNPFNPSTVVGFTLEKNGPVSLRIYDAVGREAAVLADGEFDAGVYHERTFDASQLSSGIYFARLVSGGRSTVKKMMLMK